MSNKFIKVGVGVSLKPQTSTPSGLEDGDIFHDSILGLMMRTAGVVSQVQTTSLSINNVTGLAAGILTFLTSPNSANLRSAITDETGTGALVFGTNPLLDNPTLDNGVTLTHETTPAIPSAGTVRIYPKADNSLYILDPTGTEKKVGSGGITPDAKSAGFTAESGFHYLTDTSLGSYNATLPAGVDRSVVMFSDTKETWDTYPLTIVPASGEKIDGLAINETLVCDVKRGWVELSWNTPGSFWSIRTQFTGTNTAQRGTYIAVTAAYSVLLTDYYVSASGASNYQVTLPNANAVGSGRIIVIKSRMNVGVLLNIGTVSSQTIDGIDPAVTPRTISRNESLQLISTGSNWEIF